MLPVDPFDPELCIGTVVEVGPMGPEHMLSGKLALR